MCLTLTKRHARRPELDARTRPRIRRMLMTGDWTFATTPKAVRDARGGAPDNSAPRLARG
jgi:hypothetical protein